MLKLLFRYGLTTVECMPFMCKILGLISGTLKDIHIYLRTIWSDR